MERLLRSIAAVFDTLEARWESKWTRRRASSVLAFGFFAALIAIEINRQGWMPAPLDAQVPTNHFYAIDVAFTLFLIVEVIGLVFGLASSVAKTAGKQLEIFSLIMLRQSFKELARFNEEPISWSLSEPASVETVQFILADATSALLIFVGVGVFYSLQRHQRITATEGELSRFIAAKKGLSLTLLIIFAAMGGYGLYTVVAPGPVFAFFNAFYTVLIFSDVLVVLIALRYSATFHVIFRNSGFAAATVMIRVALAGPRYFDGLIGVGAALYAIGLTAAYNYVAPLMDREEGAEDERESTSHAADAEGRTATVSTTQEAEPLP